MGEIIVDMSIPWGSNPVSVLLLTRSLLEGVVFRFIQKLAKSLRVPRFKEDNSKKVNAEYNHGYYSYLLL